MKKTLLLLLMALLTITVAEAKRRESPEEIERKTRHYSGWEWGATGRFNLIFCDLNYTHITGETGVKDYRAQARLGGSVNLNGGYFFDNHWRLGAEIGAQMQYDYTVVPVMATLHYYYGKRKTCLFNFLNLGTNVLFDHGPRFGATGMGGLGVRIQTPDSDLKYEITLGYQAFMMSPRPNMSGDYSYDIKDVSRLKLDQSVYIGFGIFF